MKTLNYLAFASLAALGRERMESMKRRTSLAWLISLYSLACSAWALRAPRPAGCPRREKRPWRSSRSEGSTIRCKRRWRRRATGSTRSRGNWQAGTLRTRRSRSAPASRLRGCRWRPSLVRISAAHRHEAAQRRLRGATDRRQRGSADGQRQPHRVQALARGQRQRRGSHHRMVC